MDIQPAEKTKIILILIFGIISVILTVYLVQVNSARQPVAVTEHSHRGSEATESAKQALELDGYEALDEALPTIAGSIPNQLLQYHYDNTKQLERHAKIEGGIKKAENSYIMRVLFPVSNVAYHVTIEVINEKTENYKLDIEEDK